VVVVLLLPHSSPNGCGAGRGGKADDVVVLIGHACASRDEVVPPLPLPPPVPHTESKAPTP